MSAKQPPEEVQSSYSTPATRAAEAAAVRNFYETMTWNGPLPQQEALRPDYWDQAEREDAAEAGETDPAG